VKAPAAAKAEPAKSTAKATPAKAETAKTDTAKTDTATAETAKAAKADTVDVDTAAAAKAAETELEAAKVDAAKAAPAKSESDSGPAKPSKPTAPVQPVWVAPAPSADADRDSVPPVVGVPSAGRTPDKSASTVDAFGSPLTVPSAGMAGEAMPENNGSSNGSDPGAGREVLVGEIVAGDAVTSRPTNGSGNPDEERDTPTLP
jgi:hypothetical protein